MAFERFESFTVDIEPTNRCNAKCHFCPRDQTPHQGLMSPETFVLALERTVQYRSAVADVLGASVEVSLCGLGEPLLNRHTPDFVRQVRAEGFACSISSNAALLDEDRSRALLDAGLDFVYLNVGETDDEYEDVYKLPFEKTRDNVVRFAEMSQGSCMINIVLVDHRRDPEHGQRMKQYWGDLGFENFVQFDIMNRGGALFVDHMEYESYPELAQAHRMLEKDGQKALCGAPFAWLFVGYDGNYYLCCSDWKKEIPLGHVSDASFVSVMQSKLDHVRARGEVCRTCNLDPVNKVTEEIRAAHAGEPGVEDVDALAEHLTTSTVNFVRELGRLEAADPDEWARGSGTARRRIPIRSV